MKPRLLDVFCGGGGCSMGYHRAGFDVQTGVDIAEQKDYPFDFVQSDALEYLARYGHEYDFIHASPPCQIHSATRNMLKADYGHEDFLPQTRALLQSLGVPYVIENVPGAPMIKPLKLRGDMFGLQVLRMRYFETNFFVTPLAMPVKRGGTSHKGKGYSTLDDAEFISVAGNNYRFEDGKKAMGIDWMGRLPLTQAIPPAYTQYIGADWLKQNGFAYEYPQLNAPIQLSLFD